MAGGTTTIVPGRRRGRPGNVARNFLAAVGNVASSSSTSSTPNYRNNNNNNNPPNDASPRTPKKSPSTSHASATPATASSSTSPQVYSPSTWGSGTTRRGSSTRSQQSGKTEPTLDTLESSIGRDSTAAQWQPQPLQRTPNLQSRQQYQQQQGGTSPYSIKPRTIYEIPQHARSSPSRIQNQRLHGNNSLPQSANPHRSASEGTGGQMMFVMESPMEESKIYSPPMFPATSPRRDHSDQSTLTASTSTRTPNTTGATLDEIRPSESYLMPSPPIPTPPRGGDPEQRTTTSSISTHSTPLQHQRASLDAHVQQKTPKPGIRHATEDWESVSTNEVGLYGQRIKVQNMPGSTGTAEGQSQRQQVPPTLGQSIDQGIDLLLGSKWVQCAAPTSALPDRAPVSATSSPLQTPTRRLWPANSSVSGASTEIATNRAVDLALKRVQEIEKSRGTEQALKEARQALVRLKDTPFLSRATPPPADVTLHMSESGRVKSAASSPSSGRLSFGTPSIPAPKCEAQSILSDSTEEGSGGHGSKSGSSIQMLPVGRLDRKVHRMAKQHEQYTEDADRSLQNESLPSSIGVEVDSKGVAKSNPALRAVFEQHTLDSLRRERERETRRGPLYRQADREIPQLDPALAAVYDPPPPPPPRDPPETPQFMQNEVRSYSMKTGQGRILRPVLSPPLPMTAQHQPPSDHLRLHAPDPIVCHGSYVSYDPNDGNESSVVPTVVHPPNLMMSLSHDSSLSGGIDALSPGHGMRKPITTSSAGLVSPISTHIPGEGGTATPDKTRPMSRFARASRLAKRWPPLSSSPSVPGHNTFEQKPSDGEQSSELQAKQPFETITSNLHSSPAWASKQRMQEVQHQSAGPASPKPSTSGSRISELRKQLFAKKPDKNSLESFVVRKHSKETLGEPAIDDTSIDLNSVRSAFESVRISTLEADEDSDDDTASVKSLKEKFEGSTGSIKESGVSKVRAMFESKSKPTVKPFEGGTSELQKVFAKFQRKDKASPRFKPQRRNMESREKMESEVAGEEVAEASNGQKNKETVPIRINEHTLSVAERIKAFGGNTVCTPTRRQASLQSHNTPKPSTFAPKIWKSGGAVGTPGSQVTPRASPNTICEARQSLRSCPRERKSSAITSAAANQQKPTPCPSSTQDEKNSTHPSTLQHTHKTHDSNDTELNSDEAKEASRNENAVKPRSSPPTIGEARKRLRPIQILPRNQPELQHNDAKAEVEVTHTVPMALEPGVILLRSSPVRAEEITLGCKTGEKTTTDSQSTPSKHFSRQVKPRSSPNTIEEARKSLRASPLPNRQEIEPRSEHDNPDENQIEQEIAAITATDLSKDTFDASVRKFDWFHRAAVEASGVSLGEDTSTDNRPGTPRVQDRVRMFASANAAINGVRRPVPTPASFNAELRDTTKQIPMTPERQRLSFGGWIGDTRSAVVDMGHDSVYGQRAVQVSSHNESPYLNQPIMGVGPSGQTVEADAEKWLRPKPRRFDPSATDALPRGFVRDDGPQQQSPHVIPNPAGHSYHLPGQPMKSRDAGGQHTHSQMHNQQSAAQEYAMTKDRKLPAEALDVLAAPVNDDPVNNSNFSSSAMQSTTAQDVEESGSEFSDGVTLDMSIAEVSGLTLPTALISRPGGETSVATVEEEGEQESENSSKLNAEVEAKRSEASSSQTSEALVPLLNRTLRQRPMSDDPSMGDSFFEARAIVANHWSKTSEIGQLRSVTKDPKKINDDRDDSSGWWDPARIEKSFPVTPSNAGDIFEFESGWEGFSVDKNNEETLFKSDEEKKSDDPVSRSTTPTRSNKAQQSGAYISKRYPEFSVGEGRKLHHPQPREESPRPESPCLISVPSLAPPPDAGTGYDNLPATSSSLDGGSQDSPEIRAISSFESAERLSRSHLARHAANTLGNGPTNRVANGSLVDPPQIHNTKRSQPARPSSFFGRTHPQASDPTWKKDSYLSYDPTLPAEPSQQQEAQIPNWRPPTPGNPLGGAMQRYGAQHAALLARLKALKEARVRRANAIYARTTSVFPRRVEIDDYSLSTKSSTQFGGSTFMESLKVD